MTTETQTEEHIVDQSSVGDQAPAPSYSAIAPSRRPRRMLRMFVVAILVISLLGSGLAWYLYARGFEETDDAQVDGHLNPITSRIDGTIKSVNVDDNESVATGKVLIELDQRDDQILLDQAKAQAQQASAQLNAAHPTLPITRIGNKTDLASQQAEVLTAEAGLAAARSDLDSAIARLKQSQATNERSQADITRYQMLYDKKEVSRALYDGYKATAASQTQAVAANQGAVASAGKLVEQRQAGLEQQRSKLEQTVSTGPLQLVIHQAELDSQRANAMASQAAVARARLKLSYCTISSPVSGVITQRSAEVGAHISAGQQLMMVVQTKDLWVTANFKETQLSHMHPGQRVRIFVDSLNKTFDGVVESLPAVTGSRTSVLPPENATGNYVKIIQRLPVRIRFNPEQKGLETLRPGMSVEPKVQLD